MVSDTPKPVGRRERKKAATRQALADAALNLFLEHGYDQVSVKDVAEAADVSTTTLFKHFPSKEALVFDEDTDQQAALVAAVRERPTGRSLPAALLDHLLRTHLPKAADPGFARYKHLILGTPVLREYGHRMWMRHEAALTEAIADETGAPQDDPACAALAHFALESVALTHGRDDPRTTLEAAFALLEHGWPGPTRGTGQAT